MADSAEERFASVGKIIIIPSTIMSKLKRRNYWFALCLFPIYVILQVCLFLVGLPLMLIGIGVGAFEEWWKTL